MTKPIAFMIAYCVATACYVLFHFNVIHKHRLPAFDSTVTYIISLSLFFLIPLVGLVHLTALKMSKRVFWKSTKCSLVVGLAGPIILHLMISTSGDGEAAMGYILIPVAYLAFCLIAYVALFIYHLLRSKAT